MKHMKKNSATLLSIRFSFSFLWKNERLIYLYITLSTLITTFNSFVLISFTKYLLDYLASQNYVAALITISVFCVWQYFFINIQGFLNKKRSLCSGRNRILMKTLLIDKLATLRYEQIESPNLLERYEFAQKCAEKGDAEVYVQKVFSMLSSVFVIGGVMYILKDIKPWVLFLMIAVIIINIISLIINAKYSYQEMTEETPVERKLYYLRGHLMNKEYGKEIRAFQLSNFILKETRHAIDGFYFINRQYGVKNNHIDWWVHVANNIQTFVFYIYNILLFWGQKITIGTFTMNVSALFQFSSSLHTVFSNIIEMFEQSVYLKDYYEFMHTVSSYCGTKKIQQKNGNIIEFVDVSFAYPGQGKYALQNINVKIVPGEKISIVGVNGAGKTTFIKLLMGLYKPTKGTIFLNGINIEQLDPKQYLHLFSAVFQDYQLYNFKIIDNLIFSENPSSDEISYAEKCIDDIGLKTVMQKLPRGIYSYLTQYYDESGVELSGGENQKLAICRALYRDSQFVILDEPTSALSPQSEYDIYSRFDQLTRSKTVFYISHRLSSCTLCDRVLVFDKGSVVEDGTHKQLLEKGALYAEMFKKQSSFYC